jgi:glycerophosphoryl diester phosphodiesterase
VLPTRGARPLFPENTLEGCQQAVQTDGAMALLVDACLTSDGEIALWHDWSPGDFASILRQLGIGDLGSYRPWVPDAGEVLRRDTIDLTLLKLCVAFGYVAVGAENPTERAPFMIPSLKDLLDAAREWPGLRRLLLDIRMPGSKRSDTQRR